MASFDGSVTDHSLDVEKGMEELLNQVESLLQESDKMQDECVGLQNRIVAVYGKLGVAKLAVDKTLDELEEAEAKAANEKAELEEEAQALGRDKEQPGEKTPEITVYRLPDDMGEYFQGRDSSPPPLHHKSSSM